MKRSIILAAAFAITWAVCAAPSFKAARSVWPKGRETRMNDFVEFRASFDVKDGDAPILRVAGCSVYRIRLNGAFAGYGPARAAKGFFRMDEWPLAAKVGRNDLSIEVSAYNCNSFYIPEQPPFLMAEVVAGDRVLAATGADFRAYETPRVTKCSRYSYQRAFGEAYRLSPDWKGAELPIAEGPQVRLVERIAPYPKFEVIDGLKPVSAPEVAWKEPETFRKARWIDDTKPWVKCYKPDELGVNLWRELQCTSVRGGGHGSARPATGGTGVSPVHAGHGVQYDAGINSTGFIGLEVDCRKAGTLYVAFDELLMDGVVNPVRYTVCNAVRYDMMPGKYRIETFEPYTFRHIHVYTLDGDFSVSNVFVRTYRSPAADGASFKSSDAAIDAIFRAAKETFAQNAVDVFTDCPGRERAGWLCDSFFIGRTAALLTGSTYLERLFIQNYLLPEKFDDMPDGMLPMCYPSDHRSGRYIPNWAMWFVIEVGEYLERSGDRVMVDALRPRLEKLVDFLWKYRNADGLLEKLPSWVFIEWSKANDYVQDVSYPSNATWAEVLDSMDRMYGRPDLAAEARRVREAVRRQSWTGKWFCDNAVRQKDGTLKPSGNCTETCQYYMFMFGVATRKSHPALWKTLLGDFGPERRETNKHPEIAFSNAFIGNFLRLELLSRAGLDGQLLDETKGYFSYMAERTGTLWEYVSDWKSCNHGFASYAAVLYARNVLGLEKIDAREKTVVVRETDVALDACELTLPVPGGEVTYGWRKTDGGRNETFRAPPGWSMRRETAAKPLVSQWAGKKVAFLGDSITDPAQTNRHWRIYWQYLADELKLEPHVYAVSGYQWDRVYKATQKMKDEMGGDVDAIMIFAGTNDYMNGIPIGEWYNVAEEDVHLKGKTLKLPRRRFCKDMKTFKGRINMVMDFLKTNFPDQQVIIMTPLHRGYYNLGDKNIQPEETIPNTLGKHLEDYVVALREAADIWSVPVIDLYRESGLFPLNDAYAKCFRYVGPKVWDKLHPNTEGHRRLAKTIAARLMTLPPDFR